MNCLVFLLRLRLTKYIYHLTLSCSFIFLFALPLRPLLAALIALATEAFGLDSIDIATLQRISDETLLVNVDSEPPKGSQAPDGQGGAGGPGGNGATVVITAMAGPKPRSDTGDSNTKKKVENAIKDLNAKLTPAVTTNLDEEVHRMFNSETERLKNLLKDGMKKRKNLLKTPIFK